MNYNNSTIPTDNNIYYNNLIKSFRTPILALNLAILLLQICLSTLKTFCLIRTSLINSNLKLALLWQSACFCIYAISRIAQTGVQFFTNRPQLFDGIQIIQFGISFGEIFSNFMGHVLLLERLFATLNARNYEKWHQKPYFTLAWFMPIFIIASFNAYRQSAFLSDGNIENDFVVSDVLLVIIYFVVILSFVEIITIPILGALNLQKYKAWGNNQKLSKEQNLSERYQLAENIRTTKQLAPVFVLHFATILLSVPIPIINFYKIVENIALIRTLLYINQFCTSINYALIEYALLSRVVILRKNALDILAILRSKVSFCSPSAGTNSTSILFLSNNRVGDRLPTEVRRFSPTAQDKHFMMLKELWEMRSKR